MLASSIAAELQLGAVIKITVKSTSHAQDLLYRVNALRRWQDAQRQDNEQAQYVYPYLSLGSLGRVIQQQKRCVVLIDEVDKADIDFPNDLLDVLDRFSFQIDDLPEEEETLCREKHGYDRTVEGKVGSHPIVVITSNREKRLPEPFLRLLRRCIYVRLRFPETPEELVDIVRMNTRFTPAALNAELLWAAVDAFQQVRHTAVGNTQKPPSTRELIDWVKILHRKGETVESLKENPALPPQWEMLFKTMRDLDAYPSLAKAKQ
jgi:MoxR-like ATPase